MEWSPVNEFLRQLKERFLTWTKMKSLVTGEIVGLDIGSDSIKLLKLKQINDQPQVEGFGVTALPEGIIVKDEIKNQTALADLIRTLFSQAKIDTQQVAIAIPRSKTIIKNITIDKRLTPEEIESRAWIEANRLFPDLVGDIYLDFFVSGASPQDATQLELVLVACRKDQITPYLNVLNLAKLQAVSVDVDAYALERCLKLMAVEVEGAIGLLNLNADRSTLIVVADKSLIYAHDQTYEGQRLRKQINTYLQNKPVTQGVDNLFDDTAYQAIFNESLLAHLRHIMQFFYTSRPNVVLKKLILSGDCSSIPFISNFVQKEINVETQLADLTAQLSFAQDVNATLFKAHASTLVLGCGLALTTGP